MIVRDTISASFSGFSPLRQPAESLSLRANSLYDLCLREYGTSSKGESVSPKSESFLNYHDADQICRNPEEKKFQARVAGCVVANNICDACEWLAETIRAIAFEIDLEKENDLLTLYEIHAYARAGLTAVQALTTPERVASLRSIGKHHGGTMAKYADGLADDLLGVRERLHADIVQSMQRLAIEVKLLHGLGGGLPKAVADRIRGEILAASQYLNLLADDMLEYGEVKTSRCLRDDMHDAWERSSGRLLNCGDPNLA